MLEEFLVEHIDTSCLNMKKCGKYLSLNIDIFLLDYANLIYLDHMARGVLEALDNLEVPELNFTENLITKEILV